MNNLPLPAPFLRGKRLDLRPLADADASGPYPAWFNDPEVCQGNSHHVLPYTPEAALDYIRRARQSSCDLVLAVILRKNRTHIGNVALQNIHHLYRTAEFAIIIGDPRAWGKGYGSEAAHLICEHGFKALNLHRIACGTFADNEPMKKLALALGMQEEGRRREAAYKNGRFVDVIEYGVLRREYEKPHRE